jgi:hypothetical protein
MDIAVCHGLVYAENVIKSGVQVGNDFHWPPKALLYENLEQPCVHSASEPRWCHDGDDGPRVEPSRLLVAKAVASW